MLDAIFGRGMQICDSRSRPKHGKMQHGKPSPNRYVGYDGLSSEGCLVSVIEQGLVFDCNVKVGDNRSLLSSL